MVQIIGCPAQICHDVMHFCKLADHFENHMPPVAGGVLDQSASFLYAVDELKYYESSLRSNNG